MRRTLATLILTVALAASGGAAQAASSPPLHPDIESALTTLPGGVALSPTTAEWEELGIRYEIAPLSTFSVGTCSTNRICAYRSTNLGGAKLTFSGCSTWNTSAFGTIRSIANARTSGWAEARNSSGTLLAHIVHGNWQNVSAGTTTIACKGNGMSRVPGDEL